MRITTQYLTRFATEIEYEKKKIKKIVTSLFYDTVMFYPSTSRARCNLFTTSMIYKSVYL